MSEGEKIYTWLWQYHEMDKVALFFAISSDIFK